MVPCSVCWGLAHAKSLKVSSRSPGRLGEAAQAHRTFNDEFLVCLCIGRKIVIPHGVELQAGLEFDVVAIVDVLTDR